MANDVAVQQGGALAIPQDLAALFGAVESNISSHEKANTLAISGKVWKVIHKGETRPITMKVDGEDMPSPTVKVIILNQIPQRSRAFFEGGFDENANKAPTCYSNDGVNPDTDVREPQFNQCQGCPKSIKGSAFTDNGEPTTACKTSKRMAVVPSNNPKFDALRLQVPVTSLWEAPETAKAKEVAGWYAYDAYLKMLVAKGVQHTAMVETVMKFDSDVNYPKVLFKYNGFISAEAAGVIAPRVNSDEVKKLLGLDKTSTPRASIAAPATEDVPLPAPKPQPKQTVVTEEDVAAAEASFGGEEGVAAKVEEKPAKTTAKKEKAKPVVIEGDEDELLKSLNEGW